MYAHMLCIYMQLHSVSLNVCSYHYLMYNIVCVCISGIYVCNTPMAQLKRDLWPPLRQIMLMVTLYPDFETMHRTILVCHHLTICLLRVTSAVSRKRKYSLSVFTDRFSKVECKTHTVICTYCARHYIMTHQFWMCRSTVDLVHGAYHRFVRLTTSQSTLI